MIRRNCASLTLLLEYDCKTVHASPLFFHLLQVSWIRSRDLRILSIGEVRYTRDSRFTPLHDAGNDVWALKIADAEMADSGEYECQVSER